MPNKGQRINDRGLEFCTECGLPYFAKGLCRLHYERKRRLTLGMKPRSAVEGCVVVGCDDLAYAKGRRQKHYRRSYRKSK
jgi:hypothetical protein